LKMSYTIVIKLCIIHTFSTRMIILNSIKPIFGIRDYGKS
jgi:hypothetical protein